MILNQRGRCFHDEQARLSKLYSSSIPKTCQDLYQSHTLEFDPPPNLFIANMSEEPTKQEPIVQEAQEEPPTLVTESEPVDAPVEEEDINSKKVTLADLSAKGDALYAAKKYEEASELFSEASNLQAEINGETAPENAEILFHYGRCLFKVGQSKSNVLGGKAPNVQEKPKKSVQSNGAAKKAAAPEASSEATAGKSEEVTVTDAKKPLFSFTGDENFDESDEEEEEGDNEEQEEEEDEDDLSIAFEILDLARVCYLKKLDQLNAQDDTGDSKGKEILPQGDSSTIKHIKERLADTHDCLAEISLENEKYPQAIEDGRTSLNYKLELYPEESEVIAEAHFKLSLALEFASVTTTEGGEGAKKEDMDQGLRDEAVTEMELAIKSFRLKLQNKEVELATMASPEENDLARTAIAEMKEVIADMDQRVSSPYI